MPRSNSLIRICCAAIRWSWRSVLVVALLFGLALPLWVAGWWLPRSQVQHPQENPTPARRGASSYLTMAVMATSLGSLLLLSACGTARSSAPTPLQVPAALLVPPREPTLLVPRTPGSPLPRPGPTTTPTPKPAPKTGSGIAT